MIFSVEIFGSGKPIIPPATAAASRKAHGVDILAPLRQCRGAGVLQDQQRQMLEPGGESPPPFSKRQQRSQARLMEFSKGESARSFEEEVASDH